MSKGFVDAGPYLGMHDSLDASAADPRFATLLQNCYPLTAELGKGLAGRPGFHALGGQLGGGSPVQGAAQFTKTDGTEYTVAVCGGKFYTYDWSTDAWTEAVTAGQLSTASITLDATSRVSLTTFFDYLIVSDGVNTPWAWDGSSVTKMTGAPVFYGPLTVRSAKLVGIVQTDTEGLLPPRSAFMWSEEADPFTGYRQPGFDNAWELGQTDSNRLVAMRGNNAGLFYWRERSCGLIYGEIASDFRTTSTHDGWTEAGTASPWAILEHDGFLFLDADGFPHRLTGSGVSPFWEQFAETLSIVPRETLGDALAVDYIKANLVLLGLTETAQQHVSMWLAFRAGPKGLVPAALFRGFTSTAAAVVKDASGVPTWVHGSSDGYVYAHGNPDGTDWDDAFVSGAAAIQHIVHGMPVAPDVEGESTFTKLDLVTRSLGTMHLSVDYDTPRLQSTAQSVTITPTATVGMVWDVSVWDGATWAAGPTEKHSAVGILTTARWIRPRITHETAGEQFNFQRWRVHGTPAGDVPSTP